MQKHHSVLLLISSMVVLLAMSLIASGCKKEEDPVAPAAVAAQCNELITGQPFNQSGYSIFPITEALRPRTTMTIHMTFNVNSVSNASMLWRYGSAVEAGQAYVQFGVLHVDFRNGTTNNLVGGRELQKAIQPGIHTVEASYDGNKELLILDGVRTDSTFGALDITQFDGVIWAGRNVSYAQDPALIDGTISYFKVCFK